MYVDESMSICRPSEVLELHKPSYVLVEPALLKVNHLMQVFPPLSVISSTCPHRITSPAWVEAVEFTDHGLIVKEGIKVVEGELKVESKEVKPLFTLSRLLGQVKLRLAEVERDTIPLLNLNGDQVIGVRRRQVLVYTHDYSIHLRLAAAAVRYYLG